MVLALGLDATFRKAEDADTSATAWPPSMTLAQAFAATLLHLRSMEMTRVSVDSQSHWKFAQEMPPRDWLLPAEP